MFTTLILSKCGVILRAVGLELYSWWSGGGGALLEWVKTTTFQLLKNPLLTPFRITPLILWLSNFCCHDRSISEPAAIKIIWLLAWARNYCWRASLLPTIGVGYKKIAKTLKLSCSMVAETIQRFNRTGSTQNRPHHGRPKKLSDAQHHIQRMCLGNRRMSAASIAAEVEGVWGQPVSPQTIHRTLHQIGLHGCHLRRKPLQKMMHKKARKQLMEPCPVV